MSTLSFKTKVGLRVLQIVRSLSRMLKLGSGSVIGGRLLLLVSKNALNDMSKGKSVVLVSGTNGKTTTTALISGIITGYGNRVATNALGANMEAGIANSLAISLDSSVCVFEVDEHWLEEIMGKTAPEVVVLLNLSRDQLDRTTEVRVLAQRWKKALCENLSVKVVANADDPLIAFCASNHPNTTWISGGNRWLTDAISCPSCGTNLKIESNNGTGIKYYCSNCNFAKPNPTFNVLAKDGSFSVAMADGNDLLKDIKIALPGSFNGLNSSFALIASKLMGNEDLSQSVEHITNIKEIAGRYSLKNVASLGVGIRMMLAKNPAGWVEALNLISSDSNPVIFAINAEIPDGKDPSWLYDVPFEIVNSKYVVAAGKRVLDLATRLAYADFVFEVADDYRDLFKSTNFIAQIKAIQGLERIDLIANYSAFQDLLKMEFV